jgi:signal transduction histidine kinase
MLTLVASGALAVFVAALGVLIFGQQTRAAALAAQRVSFVNRVSHELRTPLTNILLNIDLATDTLDDAPREATRRLDLVQEEARRLGRLIDNVLTFSRHEQGKLRVEPRACIPASVIAAVVEQFAPSLARRALEVRCTGDVANPCLLDADAFAQILANLVSNVEKYVPGGVVEIGGELREETLTVTVTDQGPGIPAEAAERIFLPFERLDSRINEGASGTGLGLAIARDLAVAMGGTLRLAPSTRGACFELRIPAPPATPLTAASAA